MDTIDNAIGAVGKTSLQAQVTAAANSLNAVEGGVAIVSNNNAHAAIASGQYVYIKNNATLAEGMYVATQSIGANGELTLSNVTPVSGGAINALQSATNQALSNVSGNLTNAVKVQNIGDAHTWNAGAVDTSSPSSNTCRIARFGRLIKIEFQCRIKSSASADDNAILFLPAKYRRMLLARGFVCEVSKTSENGIVGYCGFDSWTQNGSVVDGVYIGAINQFAGKLVAGFVLYWLQTDPNGDL
jgi:hypothetical protein